MNEETLHRLFTKYINNQCSPEEIEQLLNYFKTNKYDRNLRQLIAEQLINNEVAHDIEAALPDEVYTNIQQSIHKQSESNRAIPLKRRLMAVAAILILVIAAAGVLFKASTNNETSSKQIISSVDKILPGTDKAVLRLSNGKIISLDSLNNQTISGDAGLISANSGLLMYENEASASPDELIYNTISIPRGGQYQVILSDGTKVWLNSASTLHYPVVFIGNERNVELTGEAYFEVAKNANMPFKVKVKNTTVEVLGTHFNIMAYDDEQNLETTLLEGAVKVSSLNNTSVLKPGQQLQLSVTGVANLITNADVDEAVAWKNGLFRFNDADISSIMKQLERWYDIDVVFEGKIPLTHFGGEVSRSSNLLQVLKILETSGVHFEIEGRKLTVQP